MTKQLRYYFKWIENCNMCGESADGHKVLGKRLNQSQGMNPRRKIGIATTVVRCTNCGLIYPNPLPIPFDLQDHYGIPPESYWNEEYFKADDGNMQSEFSLLSSLIEVTSGMKSLDVGAGLGKAMIFLENLGFESFGFEPSMPFYERAISRMGIHPSKLKFGRIEDIDYDENSFDFITFGAVLEHLYDPSSSITKAMSWLKPGGIMHFSVPSSDWLVARIANIFHRFNRTDYVVNISPMHEPFHLYEFNIKSFHEHAKKNNYKLAHYDIAVCDTYLPKIGDPLIKRLMKYTKTGMQIIGWLRKSQ